MGKRAAREAHMIGGWQSSCGVVGRECGRHVGGLQSTWTRGGGAKQDMCISQEMIGGLTL